MTLTSIFFSLVVVGCVTTKSQHPPGSVEAAVEEAWQRYCDSGYCEGYTGIIIDRAEDTLTVDINGHTRYISYKV
ncbi:MAG: hypothetical protein GKS00_25675 [Alphaproteobacteria bacterium]|nr:hypothetical protein [Alphaproteobacteria bacterium]